MNLSATTTFWRKADERGLHQLQQVSGSSVDSKWDESDRDSYQGSGG